MRGRIEELVRGRIAIALVAALVAVLAVPVFSGIAGAGGSVKVKVGDNFFKPKRLEVPKRTQLRFKWVDTREQHNVAKAKGPGGDFASETTDDPGTIYKKTLRKAGRYKLICTIHPDEMVLRVKVG